MVARFPGNRGVYVQRWWGPGCSTSAPKHKVPTELKGIHRRDTGNTSSSMCASVQGQEGLKTVLSDEICL